LKLQDVPVLVQWTCHYWAVLF